MERPAVRHVGEDERRRERRRMARPEQRQQQAERGSVGVRSGLERLTVMLFVVNVAWNES